jgi:hypothetical protein
MTTLRRARHARQHRDPGFVPPAATPAAPARLAATPGQLASLAARLTTRDRWLLRMLWEHRVLTTTQVTQLAFGTTRAAATWLLLTSIRPSTGSAPWPSPGPRPGTSSWARPAPTCSPITLAGLFSNVGLLSSGVNCRFVCREASRKLSALMVCGHAGQVSLDSGAAAKERQPRRGKRPGRESQYFQAIAHRETGTDSRARGGGGHGRLAEPGRVRRGRVGRVRPGDAGSW